MLAIFRMNPDLHKKVSCYFDDYEDLNKLIDEQRLKFANLKNKDININQKIREDINSL